jgi:hypothetical protein
MGMQVLLSLAVARSLLTDTADEDILNGPEGSGIDVEHAKLMTATREMPHGRNGGLTNVPYNSDQQSNQALTNCNTKLKKKIIEAIPLCFAIIQVNNTTYIGSQY